VVGVGEGVQLGGVAGGDAVFGVGGQGAERGAVLPAEEQPGAAVGA
jgi:hypothetical protein